MANDAVGFIQSYNVLSGAAVGVTLIHTREPLRTQQVLHEAAFEKGRPFRAWDIVNGWRVYSDIPSDPPEKEPVYDAYQALRRITDMENPDHGNAWNEGIFVMHYPHWVLPKHAGFMQCLKLYVEAFAETKQRLALLVPEGFTCPAELQNDVPVLDFPLPSAEELQEMLEYTIEDGLAENDSHKPFDDEQVQQLVRNAAGMTKIEAETAFSKAIVSNIATWPQTEFEDFNKVLLQSKTEVIKRSEVLEMMDSRGFEEVGGLDLLKEYVRNRKEAFSDEARDFGVDRPRGVMLIGPPGSGKSLSAKAIAGVLGVPLIKFDVGRCFGSLVGQSEERVRGALKQAAAASPCVLLLDEVDKGLGGAHQAGGDSGVTKRLLGTILTYMQENDSPVYWVFSANRVDGLPPELLRKGRLDEVFCVTTPNQRERREILEIHLRKRKKDPAKIKMLDKAVDFSEGYVGSEIEAAVAEAVNIAFHDGKRGVTVHDIISQLNVMKPISVAFKEDFDAMARWAKNNARAASSDKLEVKPKPTEKAGPPPRRKRRMMGGE